MGSINLGNYAGDRISFSQTNERKTRCADCGVQLEAGRGVRRQVRRAAGTGYLCHVCAGEAILNWAKYSNTRPGWYHLSTWTMTLVPYDGYVSAYAIPARELAQVWMDHGADALLLSARILHTQARDEFLLSRNIPIPVEKSLIEQQVTA